MAESPTRTCPARRASTSTWARASAAGRCAASRRIRYPVRVRRRGTLWREAPEVLGIQLPQVLLELLRTHHFLRRRARLLSERSPGRLFVGDLDGGFLEEVV